MVRLASLSSPVDELDLNLNEEPDVNLNVSQVETQSELPVSEEPDVGHTQEPILAEVSTQEPIVAEVSTKAPIVEEVGTQEFSVEDVVIEDYVSSGEDGEDAEQGNGQEDESAPTDGQFFYDDEGIDTAYETKYDVQSSEDAGTDDDDDVDEDFLVDEENEIVEPDVDVHLFGISMDLPFDNIGQHFTTAKRAKDKSYLSFHESEKEFFESCGNPDNPVKGSSSRPASNDLED
ncbi:hypothetical protein Tco_1338229 [Tanacetum coccineum]